MHALAKQHEGGAIKIGKAIGVQRVHDGIKRIGDKHWLSACSPTNFMNGLSKFVLPIFGITRSSAHFAHMLPHIHIHIVSDYVCT